MANLTVKNVDPAVLQGLAAWAAQEGISVQEAARRALTRAAAAPVLADQLAELRRTREPMSWERFEQLRRRRRADAPA